MGKYKSLSTMDRAGPEDIVANGLSSGTPREAILCSDWNSVTHTHTVCEGDP